MKSKKDFSNELLEAVKEARKEYKSGKMKSYKNIDDLILYLKKIKTTEIKTKSYAK